MASCHPECMYLCCCEYVCVHSASCDRRVRFHEASEKQGGKIESNYLLRTDVGGSIHASLLDLLPLPLFSCFRRTFTLFPLQRRGYGCPGISSSSSAPVAVPGVRVAVCVCEGKTNPCQRVSRGRGRETTERGGREVAFSMSMTVIN